MRLLRFMSTDEAIRLLNAQQIRRDTDHAALGNHTNSVGACFAVDNIQPTYVAIYQAAKRLSGLVTMDVCLVGSVDPDTPSLFVPGKADYNVGTADRPKRGTLPEYSATVYSLAEFEHWWMYTPEPIPYDQNFKIISSINWQHPTLTAEGKR